MLLCFFRYSYLALCSSYSFLFYATATPEIYTLSLHDALPIFRRRGGDLHADGARDGAAARRLHPAGAEQQPRPERSEEHTSELQSLRHLVCRLLLEKKKEKTKHTHPRNKRRRAYNHT